MPKLGGVVTHMKYLLGNEGILRNMPMLSVMEPFSPLVLGLCRELSAEFMRVPNGKRFSDIMALGFWLRKSSLEVLKKRFSVKDKSRICLGKGVVFHVAPSNVPVNFAYSLFASLLCGNANIVRVPSKEFEQISIIIEALENVIRRYPELASYICLVRYGHEKEINDWLSALCDVRVVWGGDNTILDIRKSSLPIRAEEVCFADRFSISVLDAAVYGKLQESEKRHLARNFYNDTYLTDQNACTSPKLVLWLDGNGWERIISISEARKEFWSRLWEIVEKEYLFQNIQGIDKLAGMYLLAADPEIDARECKYVEKADNRLICVEIAQLTEKVCNYFGHSGFFLEYVTSNILDLEVLGKNPRFQTVGYLCDKERILPVIKKGGKGIDRLVPIGRTMDFDMFWDGYNLYERFTRAVVLD